MKYFYFLLLGCITISTINAQNILSGKITSLINEDPLSATIFFPKLEKGVVSDLDGSYSINNIPNGTYTVVISLLGYTTISTRLSFDDNGTLVENIRMQESAIEMEEVIISTPFHQLQRDNVMKVERLNINQMKSNGAITLADGISSIAGVESISTGIAIGKPVIRGLSSNRVLTYAQGVRLENQQFGDEHGLGINDAGIESVEVIKGPASLLYGSDALGGVLYINPEKFAEIGKTKADLSSTYYSNTLGTSNNFGIKTSGKKFKFLARGAYVIHSDYETGRKQRVTNTRFNEKDFKTGVGYQGLNLKSTLLYNYNRSNIGIPNEIGDQTTSKDLVTPFQEIDNHILSLENKILLKNSSLNVKAGYLFNDRREYEESYTDPSLQLKLKTFNYDVKYDLPEFGRFETIVGIQGMYQVNKNFGEEVLIPNAKTSDIGIMGTTHYHLQKIDLQAGLRFDHRNINSEAVGNSMEFNFIEALDRNFNSVNAAVGAKVDFLDNIMGRINFASGFRAPNLAELTSNGIHEGTNRYEIGSASLSNEKNYQVDLSVEFRNEHFEISGNGFYNAIQDYIYLTPTNIFIDDTAVYNYIQDNASLYGGEFGIHIHPHPLDWLHFESSFETVTGKLEDRSYLPLIPANTIKNTFRIEFHEGEFLKENFAFIRLENTLEQNNTGQFETVSPGYNLLSIGTGSTIDTDTVKLQLSFNVTNLTNEKYISHLSRLKVDNTENIGRSFNLSIKLSI